MKYLISFFLSILGFFILVNIFGEKISFEKSELQNLFENGNLKSGFRPFADPDIIEICVVASGFDVSEYDEKLPKGYFVYSWAVIIERKADGNRGFLVNADNFRISFRNRSSCKKNHQNIILEKDEEFREIYNLIEK